MAEAASIPLAAMTALQALRRYQGNLEGKTVFVPAGCKSPPDYSWRFQFAEICFTVSGTGLFACQLAKNVFKAGKVITTVSTAKVSKVDELLGQGVVDESTYRPPLPYHYPEY